MSDDFFKLIRDITRTAYPSERPAKYVCFDCCAEYDEPTFRCKKVVEPETDELFELHCNGKVVEIRSGE